MITSLVNMRKGTQCRFILQCMQTANANVIISIILMILEHNLIPLDFWVEEEVY